MVSGIEFGIVEGSLRYRKKVTYRPVTVEQDGLVEILSSRDRHLIREISYMGEKLPDCLERWIIEEQAVLFGTFQIEWDGSWSEWLPHAEDGDFQALLDNYNELNLGEHGEQIADGEITEIEYS